MKSLSLLWAFLAFFSLSIPFPLTRNVVSSMERRKSHSLLLLLSLSVYCLLSNRQKTISFFYVHTTKYHHTTVTYKRTYSTTNQENQHQKSLCAPFLPLHSSFKNPLSGFQKGIVAVLKAQYYSVHWHHSQPQRSIKEEGEEDVRSLIYTFNWNAMLEAALSTYTTQLPLKSVSLFMQALLYLEVYHK